MNSKQETSELQKDRNFQLLCTDETIEDAEGEVEDAQIQDEKQHLLNLNLLISDLFKACKQDNVCMAILLMPPYPRILGAQILNAQNRFGKTMLHIAAETTNNEYLLKFLLDKGADIFAIDHHGRTPFHCACISDNRLSVEFFLSKLSRTDHKKNYFLQQVVNIQNLYGMTALHFLALRGNTTLMYSIASYKVCDFSILNLSGNPPLHYMLHYFPSELLRLLLDSNFLNTTEGLNSPDKNGETLCQKALQYGNAKIAHAAISAHVKKSGGDNMHSISKVDKLVLQKKFDEAYKLLISYESINQTLYGDVQPFSLENDHGF